MSNLVFEPKWNASINQVEAGEEIRGGVDGTANIATKQLAENIFYLKDNMYSLVGYIPPDLTDDVQEIIQSTKDRFDNVINQIVIQNEAILAESRERIKEVSAANDALRLERDERIAKYDAINAALSAESTQRIQDILDEQLQRKEDILNSAIAQEALLAAESKVLQDKLFADALELNNTIAALGTRVDTELDGITQVITQTSQDLSTATEANANILNALKLEYEGNKASVLEKYTAFANEQAAQAELLVNLRASVDGSQAELTNFKTATAEKDLATAEEITGLKTKVDGNEASFNSQIKTVSDTTSAHTQQLTTLSSKMGAVEGTTADLIIKNTAVTTLSDATAEALRLLKVEFGDSSASFDERITTNADANSALTTKVTNLESTTDSSLASIRQKQETLTTEDAALATSISTLTSTFEGQTAQFSEQLATLTSDNLASVNKTENLRAQLLGGYDGNDLDQVSEGLLHQEKLARVTDKESLVQQIGLLAAGVGEQFDPKEIWHFSAEPEGWVGGVFQEGYLRVTNQTVISPKFELSGTAYRYMKMRIIRTGSPVWQGKLTYNNISSKPKEIIIPEPLFVENVATIDIDTKWLGPITDIQLKLASTGNATNYILIDWIAIGRPAPGASSAAMLDLKTTTATRDEALSQSITQLSAALNTTTAELNSTINTKTETLTTAQQTQATNILTLESKVDNLDTTLSASISRNDETITTKHNALATTVETLKSNTDNANALITAQLETITTVNTAQTQRIDSMKTSLDAAEADIISTKQTLVDDKKAFAEDIGQLSTKLDDNTSLINTQLLSLVDKDKAFATDFNSLSVRFDNAEDAIAQNSVDIVAESTARADAISAQATKVNTLEVKVDGNNSSITDKLAAEVTKTNATNEKLTVLRGEFDNNTATYIDRFKSITDAASAEATKLNAVRTEFDSNKSTVANEITTINTNATSLAESVSQLSTNFNDNTVEYTSKFKVLTDKDKSLGDSLEALSASFTVAENELETLGGIARKNTADITAEAQVRADAITAEASQRNALKVEIDGNLAGIRTDIQATATSVAAEIKKSEELAAEVAGNKALIKTNYDAQVALNQTSAEKLDFVSAELDGGYADKTKYALKNKSIQWTRTTSLASALFNTNEKINNLNSQFGNNIANFSESIRTLSNENMALAEKTEELKAEFIVDTGTIKENLITTNANISALELAIAGPDGAIALKTSELRAEYKAADAELLGVVNSNSAAIKLAETAIVNANSSIAEQKTTITTEYKAEVKDAKDAAIAHTNDKINSIEIGGRNLLKGTQDFSQTYWSGNLSTVAESTLDASTSMIDITNGFSTNPSSLMGTQGWNFIIGQVYTVSVYARTDVEGVTLGVTAQTVGYQQQPLSSEWKLLTWTFTATNGSLTRFRFETNGLVAQITKPKIERGNKATDWTPAPEDVSALIVKATADATKSVSDLQKEITTTFKDEVISRSEAKSIKTHISQINSDRLKLAEKYNSIIDNSLISTITKNNLSQSMAEYNASHSQLVSYIDNSISDGLITKEESDIVASLFAAHGQSGKTLTKYFEDANKDIIAKTTADTKLFADEAAKKAKEDAVLASKVYVDSIEIGGQNLVLGTYDFNGWVTSHGNSTITTSKVTSTLNRKELTNDVMKIRFNNTSQSGAMSPITQGLIKDKMYSTKVFIRGNINSYIIALKDTTGTLTVLLSSVTGLKLGVDIWNEITVSAPITDEKIYTHFVIAGQGTAGQYIEVMGSSLKFEVGDKYTGWSPAPEDVNQAISKSLTDAKTYADDLDTVVKGAFKDGIIEQAEAAAIKTHIAQLSTEKEEVAQKYIIIYASPLLLGTFKTNLASANTAYNTAHSNLLTAINTAIADNKTTTAEKTNVDAKFALYRTAFKLLVQRFEEASKSIIAQSEANANAHAVLKANESLAAAKIDAQTKANEAQTAAQTFATAEATAKQTLAQAYADGIVTAEEQRAIKDANDKLALAQADATKKADEAAAAAEAAAKLYTDSIEIGGRNLIPYSTVGRYVGGNIAGKLTEGTYALENNKFTITKNIGDLLGFKVLNLETAKNIIVSINSDLALVNYYARYDNATSQISGSFKNIGNNTHILRLIVPAGATFLQLGVGKWPAASPFVTYYIDNIKAEKGDKATDWTPAPEDITANIDKALSDANKSLGELQVEITGTFKDGIIEQAEAISIKTHIAQLSTEKEEVSQKYAIVYASPLLLGTAKTSLASANTAYNTAHSNLLSAINTAIADKKTTTTEKANVDAKFALYQTAFKLLAQRFEEASKSIIAQAETNANNQAATLANNALAAAKIDAQTKANEAQTAAQTFAAAEAVAKQILAQAYADGIVTVEEQRAIKDANDKLELAQADATKKADDAAAAAKTYADTQISNIEIGGRNLIIFNSILAGKYILETTGAVASAGTHKATDFIPVVADSAYTLSNLTKNLHQVRIVYYDAAKVRLSGNLYSGAQPKYLTITTPANCAFVRISGDATYSPAENWKFEKGTKATDWTPAPEDINLAIAQSLTDAKTYADSLDTVVKGAFKDGIIEQAEAIAIKTHIAQLTSEKEEISQKYTTMYANTNLLGTFKTNLASANTAYNTAHKSLVDYINSSISNGKVTTVQSAAIATRFTTYQGALKTLSQRFEEAGASIIAQTEANANAQAATLANNALAAAKIDAQTKANEAQTAAQTFATAEAAAMQILAQAYADGIVTVEEQRAIKDANDKLVLAQADATKKADEAAAAAKVYADTQISNIEIGGRNYFQYRYLSDPNNWTGGSYKNPKEPIQLEPNTIYTLTIKSHIPPAEGESTNIALQLRSGADASNVALSWIWHPTISPIPQSGIRITRAFNSGEDGKVWFSFYKGSSTLWMTERMIEAQIFKGTVLQDWAPAPEDVQGEINQSLTDAKTYADGLDAVVKGAFKDSIISQAEAVAIKTHIAQLTSEKEEITQKYTTVYANTNLLGTAKTNLASANTAYNTAHKSLVDYINSSIADGAITTAESSTVATRFTTYQGALKTLSQRFEEAGASIIAKTEANANAQAATLANNALAAAKIDAQTKANEAQTAAQTFATAEAVAKQTLAQAYADGIVTAEEQRAIKDANDKLVLAQADATKKADEAAAAAKVYADTQISNIEIGGRNLIKSTDAIYSWVGVHDVKSNSGAFVYLTAPIENAIYQIEVRAISESAIGSECGFQWVGEMQGVSVILTTEWQRISANVISGTIGLRLKGSIGIIETRFIKAEKGNKITDWSPAPEDTNLAIAQSLTDAKTYADGLDTAIKGAFKDGIIEQAEAIAIKTHIAQLTSEKEEISQKYTTMYANTNLLGTAKTNLASANTAYNTAHKSLVDYINSSISNGKVTTAQSAAIATRFTTYQTAIKTLSQRFEEAGASIIAKTEANANSYTDSIEIGGRNLLKFSSFDSLSTIANTSWIIDPAATTLVFNQEGYSGNIDAIKIVAKGSNCHLRQDTPNIFKESGIHTLSFWVKGNKDGQVNIGIGQASADNKIQVTTNWVKHTITKNITNHTTRYHIVIGGFTSWTDLGLEVTFSNIKVEKGNKATDWTPAPEDTQNQIVQSLTDAKTYADGLDTVIKGSFKDGIIEQAEAAAIKTHIAQLTSEKEEISQKYTTMYDNTNLLGTFKTNLASANTAYNTAHKSLVDYINSSISNGKVTTAQSAAIATRFTTYQTAIKTLSQRFEEAGASIITQTETNALAAAKLDTFKKTHLPVRYIRDWSHGSSANTSNHWYEIEAYSDGVNVALSKTVTTNGTATSLSTVVNGSTSGTYANTGIGYHHLIVDLGKVYYDISEIKIWKYWNDGRTYRKTKTEVSADGATWFTIFDSYVEGEYAETSSGKSIIPLISKADSLPLLAAAAERAQATIDSVSAITADDKITPNEKRDLLRVKDEIVSTHTELLKSVITVPGATTPSTYTTAYSNVTTRLTNAAASPTIITNITTTDRNNLTSALSTYFTERAKLNDLLVTKSKAYTESQANTALAAAKTYANDLDKVVKGAFKDGIIEQAEAAAVKTHIARLEVEKDEIAQKYTTIYDNSNLLGEFKTNLASANTAYNTAHKSLVDYINSSISNGKVTTAQSAEIVSKFSLYQVALKLLTQRFEEATASIITQAETNANSYTDSIEIGGRNLFKNTGDFNESTWSNSTFTDYELDNRYKQGIITSSKFPQTLFSSQGMPDQFTDINSTWTLSAMFKGTEDNQTIGITLGNNRHMWQKQPIPKDVWTRVSWTFEGLNDRVTSDYFRFSNTILVGTVYIAQIKLEKGNKATDWTPAPEDINLAIAQSLTDAKTYSDNLDTVVKGAFKDGIIEQAEAAAIKTHIAQLTSEKEEISQKYTTMYANTNLLGAFKTNLASANTAYNTAHKSLVDYINSSISNGKVTTAQSAAIATRFTTYQTAIKTLSQRFEEAGASIIAKSEANANSYTDSIEIGGRNLLTPDITYTNGSYYHHTTGAITSSSSYVRSSYFAATPGKYVFSLDPQFGKLAGARIAAYDASMVFISGGYIASGDLKFVAPPLTAFLGITSVRGANLHLKWKLETGDKATGWSPAPEETSKIISDLDTAVSDFKNVSKQAFEDGIITKSEAKTIATSKAHLDKSMLEISSRYLAVYNNTSLTGTPKTTLKTAYDAWVTSSTALTSYMATSISNSSVSAAQSTEIGNRFNTYNAKLDILASKFEEAQDAIINNTANTAVNNLEIGGTNLFSISSSGITKGKYLLITDAQTTSATWGISDYIPVKPGKSYTWSGYSSITTPANNFYDINKVFISGFTGNNRLTMVAPPGAAFLRVSYQTRDINITKVEQGNKATDWSPNPDDINKIISDLDTAVSDFKNVSKQAFEDGIISTSESKSMKSSLIAITESYNQLIYQSTYLKAHNYVSSVETTKLTTAESAYTTAYDTLKTKISGVISAGAVTTAIANSVISDITALAVKQKALQVALESARSSKETYATDVAVNGIELGGRNYLKNSDFNNDVVDPSDPTKFNIGSLESWTKNGTVSIDTQDGLICAKVEGTTNGIYQSALNPSAGIYTISFTAKGSVAGVALKVGFLNATGGFSEFPLTTVMTRYTFTTTRSITKGQTFHIYATAVAGIAYITDVQVEKGNKATDWKLNDDEISKKIYNAKTSIAITNKSVSDANSAAVEESKAIRAEMSRVAGVIHFDMIETKADWIAMTNQPEIVNYGDGIAIGNNAGNDEGWLVHPKLIKVQKGIVYKVTAKVQNVTAGNSLLIGATGVAANGTTFVNAAGSNSYSGQHYAINGYNKADTTYIEHVGYIGSFDTDLTGYDNAVKLHKNAVFFRPTIIANNSAKPGIVRVIYYKLELIDVDNYAAVKTASTAAAKANGDIEALYSINITGTYNGKKVIGGMKLGTSNDQTYVAFDVAKFEVVNSAGEGGTPFKIVNNTVYADKLKVNYANIEGLKVKLAEIDTASITTLSSLSADVGSITAGSITGASLTVGQPSGDTGTGAQFDNSGFKIIARDATGGLELSSINRALTVWEGDKIRVKLGKLS